MQYIRTLPSNIQFLCADLVTLKSSSRWKYYWLTLPYHCLTMECLQGKMEEQLQERDFVTIFSIEEITVVEVCVDFSMILLIWGRSIHKEITELYAYSFFTLLWTQSPLISTSQTTLFQQQLYLLEGILLILQRKRLKRGTNSLLHNL